MATIDRPAPRQDALLLRYIRRQILRQLVLRVVYRLHISLDRAVLCQRSIKPVTYQWPLMLEQPYIDGSIAGFPS